MSELADRSPRWKVIVALVSVQVFFGLHYLAAKVVLEEIPPRAWAAIRIAGAAALMLAVAPWFRARMRMAPKTLARLAVLALFGVGINQVCFVEGLSRTTPTHSSLINTMIPVITLAFAVMLRHERLLARKVLAMVLAFAGVLLVIRPGPGDESGRMLLGDALTLINATSYALFLVLSRRLIRRLDALASTTWLMLCGAIYVGLFGARELAAFSPATVSPRAWLLGAFIVVFATAGAYLLSYWALRRVSSSEVASFIFLQPLIATALSMLLLGDRPGWTVFAGAALILSGVWAILSRP